MFDTLNFTSPVDREYAEIVAEMNKLNELRKQLNESGVKEAEEINAMLDRIELMVVIYGKILAEMDTTNTVEQRENHNAADIEEIKEMLEKLNALAEKCHKTKDTLDSIISMTENYSDIS